MTASHQLQNFSSSRVYCVLIIVSEYFFGDIESDIAFKVWGYWRMCRFIETILGWNVHASSSAFSFSFLFASIFILVPFCSVTNFVWISIADGLFFALNSCDFWLICGYKNISRNYMQYFEGEAVERLRSCDVVAFLVFFIERNNGVLLAKT